MTASDRHALPRDTGPGRRDAHPPPRLPNRHQRRSTPARVRQLMVAVAHGVEFELALDALCARARSRPMSRSEVDVGPAADLGMLARVPKLVANELAF